MEPIDNEMELDQMIADASRTISDAIPEFSTREMGFVTIATTILCVAKGLNNISRAIREMGTESIVDGLFED